MEKFMSFLEGRFPQYKNCVDGLHDRETKHWFDAFDAHIADRQRPFFQAIFNIIHHFLDGDITNNGTTPDQLFIQVPMKELGRTSKQQKENQNLLHETIANALLCATANMLRANTECRELSDSKEGDTYYNKTGNCPGFWIMRTNSKKELTPQWIRHRWNSSKNAFYNQRCTTIRVSASTLKAATPQGLAANTRSVDNCINKILSLSHKNLQFIEQYASATIIGSPDTWCNSGSIVGNEFIESPVRTYTNVRAVPDLPEILVLVGVRKYNNFERTINNALARGKVKKVIYIGSHIFDGYDLDPRNVRYSFSFRELFTYFYGVFPRIYFHKLEFPWLFDTLTEFTSLLSQMNVDKSSHKSILTMVAYKFLGMDFETIPADYATRISEKLLFDFGITDESIDCFLKGLQYRSKNPKKLAKEKVRGQCLIVSDKRRVITDYFREYNNRNNQNVFIDFRGDWRGNLDIIETLLSSGILGEYHIYSYTELSKVQNFFKKELQVYNNPYRVSLLQNISFQASTIPTSLSDYFDSNMLDSLIRQESTTGARSTVYVLEGSHGLVPITGDVIYADNTKPLSEILEEKQDIFPTELTYYIQPDNFDQLMEIYFNLPRGENVEYFSNLWKDRLRSFCDNYFSGNVKKMARTQFPFMVKQLSSAYIDKTNKDKPKFPECMKTLAIKMHSLNIVSENEMKMLIAAHSLTNQHQVLGRNLKDALFSYRISGGRKKSPILSRIEFNAKERDLDIDTDSIINVALVTDTFTNIEKQKK